MHSRRFVFNTALAAIALGPATAYAGLAPVAPAEGFNLLNRSEIKWRQPIPKTRALVALRTDGPGVQVASPRSDRVASPVNFDVTFTPRNGATPVMSSLKIEYNMGPFWKDVTSRVMGAAQVDGFRMRATGAQLPGGRHVLRMRIKDTAGRETMTRIELTVTG